MLEFADARRNFGRTVALDGLTLSAQPGEVLGLLGPNGAGKSTAIALASGMLAPESGTVRIDGMDPRRPAARRGLGLVPQSIALYDTLTPTENLVLFARIAGLDRGEARSAASRWLDRLSLSERAGHRVGSLSGGMQRRLNLAAALVHEPRLVLMDEPTANVDPQSRSVIFEVVRELRAQGRTVVYCTHYMEEAERLCDRVAVVDRGRVIALGDPDELVRSAGGESSIEFERGGTPHAIRTTDPSGQLARLIASDGVTRLRVRRPDLESLFLQLTGRSLDS
ncbi:MAG: ABC transporter ATP-binding protein [Phycisphaerales bacterium]